MWSLVTGLPLFGDKPQHGKARDAKSMAAITPLTSMYHWVFHVIACMEECSRVTNKQRDPSPCKVTKAHFTTSTKACTWWDADATQTLARNLVREACGNGLIDASSVPPEVRLECKIPTPEDIASGKVSTNSALPKAST